MIERFQPYNGVTWTKTLRDISNPDKHRTLTALIGDGFYNFKYDGPGSLKVKPLVINPEEWEVDASYAIYVAPANLNEPALMPTLYDLEAGVCEALELFKTEF